MLCQADDLLEIGRRDPRLATTPRTHLAELGQPLVSEPAPPRAGRDRVTPTAAAILALATPSAAINNTLARFTSRCAAAKDRAGTVNASR